MIPEGLKLFRDMINKTMHPLGLDLKNCGRWCSYAPKETIVYSGCLHSTMDIIMQKRIIRTISSYPRSKLVKLSKPVLKIGFVYRMALKTKSIISDVPRKAIEILRTLGYDVGCLPEEPYSGALLYDLGFIDDFAGYTKRVYDYLKKHNIKRIITLDPHTYTIMKWIYPEYIENYDLEVLNILDILLKAIEEQKLKFNRTQGKITIHDPCFYARSRYRVIIDEPRKILKAIPNIEIVEPNSTKNMTWCCGGPVEGIYGIVAEKISEKRAKQLLDTEAKKIVVMCPVCMSNLSRSVKKLDPNVEILDIIDIVYDAMRR